jgi:membrane associated rhomboid family serine protease
VRRRSILDRFTFGGRVSGAIGLILSVTIVTSLIAAFGTRHDSPLFELGSLIPARVLRGEVWRLVTWAFIETSPLALLFRCLALYWFGGNLADAWGARRFFSVYLGIALVASVGTCLVALIDRDLVELSFVGSWPLALAITVAWGLWFPTRVMRIYFVIPIKGYVLAWGTVALTVAYAVYYGWEHVMPSLLAEGSMLAWLYRAPLVARWETWKRARAQAARQQRVKQKSAQRMATVHVLHKLEEHDDDLPPLPPEVAGKLGRILEDAARDQRKARDDDKKDKGSN